MIGRISAIGRPCLVTVTLSPVRPTSSRIREKRALNSAISMVLDIVFLRKAINFHNQSGPGRPS